MKVNKTLQNEIFKIIQNQMRENNPPEIKLTNQRLLDSGYNEFQVKQLIGQCVGVELFYAIKKQEPFNEARYIKNLQRLPKEPIN